MTSTETQLLIGLMVMTTISILIALCSIHYQRKFQEYYQKYIELGETIDIFIKNGEGKK